MIRAPRWLTPPDLEAVLDDLAATAELIAPVGIAGEVVFRRVTGAREICRDYVNALAPPKEYFLPTPERLLRYRLEAGAPRIEADGGPGAPELVLFGLRSCDVAGLAYLASFLSGGIFERADLADTPFLERRDRATLLSVVCQKPGDTCMCVCCQGGPALEQGYDWQLTELAAGWLVEIGSDRGQELAERFAGRLGDAPPEAARDKEDRVRDVVQNFERYSANRVQTMAAGRMLSTGRLSAKFWSEVGERCFECGGCAFVCPTCYCFNVADLGPPGAGEHAPGAVPAVPGGATVAPQDGTWERVRLRDCCMLAGYVREAGGSYPRWSCGERCSTRFFHKLSWQFHARMGMLGCTGCGRCTIVCPGGIGIDRVTEEMTAALIAPRRPAPCAGSAAKSR